MDILNLFLQSHIKKINNTYSSNFKGNKITLLATSYRWINGIKDRFGWVEGIKNHMEQGIDLSTKNFQQSAHNYTRIFLALLRPREVPLQFNWTKKITIKNRKCLVRMSFSPLHTIQSYQHGLRMMNSFSSQTSICSLNSSSSPSCTRNRDLMEDHTLWNYTFCSWVLTKQGWSLSVLLNSASDEFSLLFVWWVASEE